jgi:UDP-N-acetylmuramate--alanine ligase
MIDFKKIRKIYFIGIGGIGMSALARYFKFHGKEVSGYDKTETSLTRQLIEEGIAVHYVDDVAMIPKDAGLVVYTPAVPKDHKELLYYQQHHFDLFKRSEVLGEITRSSFNICVAGTHGKTTITTMIAHILRHSGFGCNAFLGGISVNYNSNFWSDSRNLCVIEADEYDRSFLTLSPDIAVITAMDPDHLDIYGTTEALEQAFVDFSKKVKPGGLLLSKYELKKNDALQASNHMTYSLADKRADAFASDVRVQIGSYQFSVIMEGWRLDEVLLQVGGMHNVENVTAAIAVARILGLENEKIKKAVEDFKGVKRRFEYILKPESENPAKGIVFIDDYAHHPEELRALISSAKQLFPERKCTVVFQPHLYSRTRDFAQGFAESLDLADEVILLPIYPARELPIAGVNSEMILKKMDCSHKYLMDKTEIMEWLSKHRPELLITAGAGDIDGLVMPIKEIIEKNY